MNAHTAITTELARDTGRVVQDGAGNWLLVGAPEPVAKRVSLVGSRSRWDRTAKARKLIERAISTDIRPDIHTTANAMTRDETREYNGPIADALDALRWEWLFTNYAVGQRDGKPYQPTVAEAIDRAATGFDGAVS